MTISGRRSGSGGEPRGRREPARKERRPPRPLDSARLEELALAYVARFATSAGKLSTYLARKLRERGWEGQGEDDPAGGHEAAAAAQTLVARFVALGYVDDAGFARARSASLQRRGLGRRRIVQALGEAGITGETAAEALPGEHEARSAALALARKRRLGPFGPAPADPRAARAQREKQIGAMLRAGHALDSARELVNAASVEAAEAWAEAAREEGRD